HLCTSARKAGGTGKSQRKAGISSKSEIRMTNGSNDEFLMTNSERNPNSEFRKRGCFGLGRLDSELSSTKQPSHSLRVSDFGLLLSFVIRHSSLRFRHSDFH